MTELEKIAYAKSFIDKLANGVNPIDNSTIPDGDLVNNVRLSRCFFYVSDILRQVIDSGGITSSALKPQPKKIKKQPYFLSPEQRESFEYSVCPITATEIINRIIAVGPQEGVKKFPRRNLIKWFISLGFIEEYEFNGKKVRRPTPSGEEIGIMLEERQGQYGSYCVILYNSDAQHFIIDNIDAVLEFDSGAYKEKSALDNQGRRWEKAEDDKLIALFNDGFSVKEIASLLGRGEKAIRIRLRKNEINPDLLPEEKLATSQGIMPESDADESTADGSELKITCQSCRFARSGECFPQKEICADYEKAYDVPRNERSAWPEMGDASYLRQNGRRR